MPNELFRVGDCVVSKYVPTMIGTITHVIGECGETNIIVMVGDRQILGAADCWKKVKSNAE